MGLAHISIEPLAASRAAEAWPLLLIAGKCAVPEWWSSEAEALSDRGGGILVARALDGSVHGLATHECITRGGRRLLVVHRLVTMELNRREPTKHALRDCLELIAMEKGCGALAIRSGQPSRATVN